MSDQRYPLSWPDGWVRTPYGRRRPAAFSKRRAPQPGGYAYKHRLDVGDGLQRLIGELRRLGARQVIISSNAKIRQDGLPYAQQAFAGYTALPQQASPWWTVLEFDQRPTSMDAVEARYHRLAQQHHPDRGGSVETMAKINAARDAARFDLANTVHA